MVTVKISMAVTPLVKHTHFKSSHGLLRLSFLLYPAPLCVLRRILLPSLPVCLSYTAGKTLRKLLATPAEESEHSHKACPTGTVPGVLRKLALDREARGLPWGCRGQCLGCLTHSGSLTLFTTKQALSLPPKAGVWCEGHQDDPRRPSRETGM